MRFAHVVPLRRMPPDRPWLTYSVPDKLTIEPGSLVSIPLRGKPQAGIAWEILEQKPTGDFLVQPINEVFLSAPIVSAWQHRVYQALAHTGSTSLGEVLFGIIPKLTVKKLIKIFDSDAELTSKSIPVDSDSFLWYRERQIALNTIRDIVQSSPTCQLAIVTPTNDDAKEIVTLVESVGRIGVHLHSQLAPTVYASWYQRIRSGEPIVVVGGIRAVAMPYPQPPIIILDQEDHHAHKQTAQFPRYDARVVLQRVVQPLHITAVAPTLSYYQQQHPTPPTGAGQRQLISLQGPRQGALVSDGLVDIIDQSVSEKKSVVCISPRRGYASSTVCRSCGTAVSCPTCGRRASLFRGLADEARCRSCQTSFPLNVTCVKCGSTDWSFKGFGIEQTVAALQQLRPALSVVPVVTADIPADVSIDTYQAYRQLRQMNNLGAVVVVSGDSLLTAPDFSVSERAWQYLARLQAEVPSTPIAVQTFEPTTPFWQRWVHGDDRAWYDDEVEQRQRLHAPPFARQWIATYRGDQAEVVKKTDEVQLTYARFVTVRPLPANLKTPHQHRLLLDFTSPEDTEHLPWPKLFPLPWHLDQYPTSWLD